MPKKKDVAPFFKDALKKLNKNIAKTEVHDHQVPMKRISHNSLKASISYFDESRKKGSKGSETLGSFQNCC
jgi:hypothetical protein